MADKWWEYGLKTLVNPTTAMSWMNNEWQDGYEALFGYNDGQDGFISLNDLNKYTDGLFLSQIQQNEIAKKYNSEQAALTRAYNSAEAQASREWSEYMSSTAYQRAVEDMKKAGINPVLAAMNGGATSFSGASAQAQASNISNSGGDTLGDVLASIVQIIMAIMGKGGGTTGKIGF